MKKLIILLIGCIILCCLFCSCEYEEPITNTQVESIKEEKKVIIPSELIGKYKEHYRQEIEGNIIISSLEIIINTDIYNCHMLINDSNIEYEGCYLTLELYDGKTIKITNWIAKGKEYIYVLLIDDNIELPLGNYDIIKEK